MRTPASGDAPPAGARIRISVIVPVYNGGSDLARCLAALAAGRRPHDEIIVVDDASTDGSGALAAGLGATVLRLERNAGPAAARNHGARHAQGDVLFFVDADVAVAPGSLDHVRASLDAHPEVAAIFGSYDVDPTAPGVVSRYKNLLHHFVHQHSATEAATFWAGCGAIRRTVFTEVGGFDQERFRRPSIEDIELGYRLRRAGHRILLDKALQGTHLKRWTMASLVRTDVMGRAVPWTRLILESGQLLDDLNLRRDQRWSAALVAFAAGTVLLVAWRPAFIVVPAAALLTVIGLNRELYAFFRRRGGFRFAVAAVLLHWFYYLYSSLAYLAVWGPFRWRALTAAVRGR
jgi:GT2 family glycosyltransferase